MPTWPNDFILESSCYEYRIYYILGAGRFGVLTALDLEKHGFKANAFIDTNAKQIKNLLGLPVLELEEVLSNKNDRFKIIIAVGDDEVVREITKKLLLVGLKKNSDFIISPLISIPVGYFNSVEDCQEWLKERYDIFFRDEETARYLANSWDGICNESLNLIFVEDAIPIVLCADENYAPYMAVMLQSLLDYSNPQRRYHFIIFERGFTAKTKSCLTAQVSKFSQCMIDFIDMVPILNGIQLRTVAYYSVDVFSRLFIPYLLDKYSKVIYFDCDMIANADVSELYDIDMSGYCMATVAFDVSSKFNDNNFAKRKHVLMFLKKWTHYLNSGILVYDTQKFIKKFPYQKLFRFAIYYTNRFREILVDQDVLNILINGEYFVLSQDWNYLGWLQTENGRKDLAEIGIKIIHFSSSKKPWNYDSEIANNPLVADYRNYANKVPLFRCALKKQ